MVTKRLRLAVWWERLEMPLKLALFVLGASLLALVIYWQKPRFEIENFGSNLTFFILINLNIALLFVFVFLVARNIVKLIFERKQNILGSKLKEKLIFAFGGLTLVPTIIIFILSSTMLSHSMEEIFSKNILEAITGANELAQNYYGSVEKDYESLGSEIEKEIGKEINNLNINNPENKKEILKGYFSSVIQDENVFDVTLVDDKDNVVADFTKQNIKSKYKLSLDGESIKEIIKKHVSRSIVEEVGKDQVMRIYYPIRINNEYYALVLTGLIDKSMNESLLQVEDAYKDYENLLFHKNPVRSSYLLTLAMMTMLILFAAIWVAFYIAKEITVPIEKLANATKQVAHGDYDCVIKTVGSDEISYLSRSFNMMLSDLKQSKRIFTPSWGRPQSSRHRH